MRQGRVARQAEAQGMEILLKVFAALWATMDRDSGGLVDDKHHPVAIEKPGEQFFVGHGCSPS
jgi:hypothetical protein